MLWKSDILLWKYQQPTRQKQLLRLYTTRSRSSSLSRCAAATTCLHHDSTPKRNLHQSASASASASFKMMSAAISAKPFPSSFNRRYESASSSSQSSSSSQGGQEHISILPDPSLVNAQHCPSDFTESSAVVYRDVISDKEATTLVQDLSAKLKRRRYERGHWDAVIIKYKEMELVNEEDTDSNGGGGILSTVSRAVLQRIRQLLEQQHLQHKNNIKQKLWLPCHVIELAKTGELNAHVDSVRFSGDIVAGLSLQSASIMRLKEADGEDSYDADTHDGSEETNVASVAAPLTTGSNFSKHDNDNNSSSSSKSFVDLHLPPKSLYVLSGPSRYRYTHELLPDGATFFNSNNIGTIIHRQDRLSIIFRDARQEEQV